jgi:hypothetical protein
MKKHTKSYYALMFRINHMTGKYDLYTPEAESLAEAISKLRRLARKHHRVCEMECNGVGYLKGHTYYNGAIDDYARRTYGASVKSAYLTEDMEETVFDKEYDRIADKVKAICQANGLTCEFQGDPRGATVRIFKDFRDLTDLLWD